MTTHESGTTAELQATEAGAYNSEPDLVDTIADAATTLSGIADALAYRTAIYPDDMLELLASAAESQAAKLRKLNCMQD